MKKSKRILVAPLNWGLGHATRSIPIINKLLEHGFEVLLASDGRALQLLKKEFPNLKTFELPAYDIRYSTNNMMLNIALQIPKILAAIWKENIFVKKVIKKEEIDIIISDNRFGCKNKHTKNIFITHQLNIIIPSRPLEWFVNKINHFLINQFDECWIPDIQGEGSLAGKLSKNKAIKNVKYLGPLSRMEEIIAPKKYDIIVVISGPEPQRTNFEKIIVRELKAIEKKCLIVQGKTDVKEQFRINGKIEVVSYLNSKKLNIAIQASNLVICRSGYSSIMDLVKLKKKAILVPTPGQTEQEYLADRLKENNLFGIQLQETFSLKEELDKIENYCIKKEKQSTQKCLNKAILSLKNQIFQKHLA